MNITTLRKHLMTGISFMIPVVVAGGILMAMAKGFGGYDIGSAVEPGATLFANMDPFTWDGFWWGINQTSSYAMSMAVPVMSAGVAYSIAEKPGIAPGLILGMVATGTQGGFLAGILVAFALGFFINHMKTWKVPGVLKSLMPVLIIPVISTLVVATIYLMIFARPFAAIMNGLQQWIMSLNGGSKALIGFIIGISMGFDLGGPVNKTASLAANALAADGIFGPMSAKLVGGMTPPLGAWLSTVLAPSKFSQAEKDTGKAVVPMGLSFITEGVIPFAAADPIKFILSSMLGSGIAGAIAVGMGVESMAPHGGIFVIPMMINPLWFIIALVVGSIVTGVMYAIIRKELPEEVELELDDDSFDIEIG